jgi:hypothetical protein
MNIANCPVGLCGRVTCRLAAACVMTAPPVFDGAGLNEARSMVAFFRPEIRPVLLSEIAWLSTSWNGQRDLRDSLVADILADGFVLKAAT